MPNCTICGDDQEPLILTHCNQPIHRSCLDVYENEMHESQLCFCGDKKYCCYYCKKFIKYNKPCNPRYVYVCSSSNCQMHLIFAKNIR